MPFDITGWFNQYIGVEADIQIKLLISIAAIMTLVIIQRLVLHMIYRSTSEDNRQVYFRWRKILAYITGFLSVIIVGPIWLTGLQSLATLLGLVSAGLAIALRDPLTDLAGWVFIVWRAPFSVGDRIQVGGVAGDVIDIRIFQTVVLEVGNWVDADQTTGRIVYIPNKLVFNEPQANYTAGFNYIWNEIPITITFESDWKEAKKLLLEIAQRHASGFVEEAQKQLKKATASYMIKLGVLTPTVYTRVVQNGVQLTIRHLTEVRRRRGTAEMIWEDILTTFGERADITLAYPTQRFYTPENEAGRNDIPERLP